MRRSNPIRLADQPSLFGGDEPTLIAWRQATPTQLLQAAKDGRLPEEDLEEIVGWEEYAQGRGETEALVADGMSLGLAQAIVDGLGAQLSELGETVKQVHIAAFVDYWKSRAESDVEMQTTEGGHEYYLDSFLEDLQQPSELKRIRVRVEDLLAENEYEKQEDVTSEILDEVLADPELYTISVNNSSRPSNWAMWTAQVGRIDGQADGPKHDAELRDLLEPLTEEAFDEALKTLRDDDPYLQFSYANAKFRRDLGSISYTVSKAEDWLMEAKVDYDALIEKLEEALGDGKGGSKSGPEHDDVAYRYDGTNQTVAGAAAQGMYVAKLRTAQLSAEGAALGICVGRKDMGYRDKLADGQIALYSIRTEVGKPKFTIEVDLSPKSKKPLTILQVKGKANRVPGFEPGKTAMTKADEVRIVAEFLMHLGFTPEEISGARDTSAGVRALQDAGVDPFTPPPVRKREKGEGRPRKANPLGSETLIVTSPEAAEMAEAAMARPWGGDEAVCDVPAPAPAARRLRPNPLAEAERPEGRRESEPETVVYRFRGSRDSVGGPEGKGMYVVALRPHHLGKEADRLDLDLGLDGGNVQRLLEQGELALYSFRTEADKPKLLMEISRSPQRIYPERAPRQGRVTQVKGKMNRIPGFEPGRLEMTKPVDLRLVVEFLLHLGYTPDEIGTVPDLAPGLRALASAGVNAFEPAPSRSRERGEGRARNANPLSEADTLPTCPRAQRMAQVAMARPWGGRRGR